MSLNYIKFNNNKQYIKELNPLFLQESDIRHENIVIREKEEYMFKWLFLKVKNEKIKYYVYLSQDVYDRFHDGEVIYKCDKGGD